MYTVCHSQQLHQVPLLHHTVCWQQDRSASSVKGYMMVSNGSQQVVLKHSVVLSWASSDGRVCIE